MVAPLPGGGGEEPAVPPIIVTPPAASASNDGLQSKTRSAVRAKKKATSQTLWLGDGGGIAGRLSYGGKRRHEWPRRNSQQ